MTTVEGVNWLDDAAPYSMKDSARKKLTSWFHGAQATVLQLWDSHDTEPTYYAVLHCARLHDEIHCVRLFSLHGAGYEISVDSKHDLSRGIGTREMFSGTQGCDGGN